MKKILALLLSLSLVMCLAACGSSQGEAQSGEEKLTLALVVAGNFGDRSFYDSSNAGATRLEAEGVTVKRIECGNEKHTEQIYNAADAADIVVLVVAVVKGGEMPIMEMENMLYIRVGVTSCIKFPL